MGSGGDSTGVREQRQRHSDYAGKRGSDSRELNREYREKAKPNLQGLTYETGGDS
jgi:hypothetical protein